MNLLVKIIAYFISLPARAKGMKFGRGSKIAPGYDWLFEQLRNINIGDNCLIGRNSWIHTVENGQITIGNGTNIGRNATIGALSSVSIGNDCLLSFGVTILDHDHEFNKIDTPPIKSGLTKPKDVIIEDDCFIGAHTFILKGVKLGKHCVVGAGSVVTKSFPSYSIIVGNPAKFLKNIKESV